MRETYHRTLNVLDLPSLEPIQMRFVCGGGCCNVAFLHTNHLGHKCYKVVANGATFETFLNSSEELRCFLIMGSLFPIHLSENEHTHMIL